MHLENIIAKLKRSFSNDDIKKAVLSKYWYKKNKESEIDSTGFCYAASEVIYRLTGEGDSWKKVSISQKNWEHGGHCYLIKKEDNLILDITSDQYTNRHIVIPYDLGKAGGFRSVSNAAIKLAKLANLPFINS
jgi:hypothetical protein